MDSSSQDRNLPASERKLQKAREEGQVPRSRELTHLAVLGGGAALLLALLPWMMHSLMQEFALQLRFDAHTLKDLHAPLLRLQSMSLLGLQIGGAFGVVIMLLVVGSSLASGGWVLSFKPLMPDLAKLDPLAGLGRLFSKEKFSEVLKMAFIAGMLLWIGALHLTEGLQTLGALALQPSALALNTLADWLTQGVGLMLLVILLVALVDVPLQSFLFGERMKMSHQEVKQEHKEAEGSPELKGRRRQRQREIAMGQSIRAVPKADFVLMNPTHYAVAVRYDDQSMAAPKVISKGADLLALRIRDIAREHKIPVIQSPVLARALFAHAEIDQEIPTSLYTAVAQVLAYVYRLKANLRGEGPNPGEPPVPFVPPELDPHSKVIAAESAAS